MTMVSPRVDHVERRVPAVQQEVGQPRDVVGNAERAGQVVATTGRHDPHRPACGDHALGDVAHEPVAADRDHDASLGCSRARGLDAVRAAAGQFDADVGAGGVDASGERRPVLGGAAAAGDRVDQRGEAAHVSRPARRGS